MKIVITSILSALLTLSLHGKEFPGYYVNLNGDTTTCNFDVKVNMFKKNLINQLSFRKKIKIIAGGKTMKYKPDEIRMFQIDSTSNGSEKYVPLQVDGRMWFVRVVDEGKINLYEFFFPHGYDGSVMTKYVIHKEGKSPKSIAKGFWRKNVLKYLDNEEWFNKEIKQEGIKYINLPEIVMTYNLE